MNKPTHDATGHANLQCPSTYGVEREGSIKTAIENDGTLIISVTCEFTVHHAAQVPVTKATLMGLIKTQGVSVGNIGPAFVVEANND